MATKKSMAIWVLLGGFIIIACVLGFAPNTKFDATAQQAAPKDSKGVTRTLLKAIDLGPEIAGMQGRQLELRMVTIEPGGVAGEHSHKDLPGAAYLLKGTVTEHRGDAVKVYQAGDSLAEIGTHWAENRGTVPAVLIVGIITKP